MLGPGPNRYDLQQFNSLKNVIKSFYVWEFGRLSVTPVPAENSFFRPMQYRY